MKPSSSKPSTLLRFEFFLPWITKLHLETTVFYRVGSPSHRMGRISTSTLVGSKWLSYIPSIPNPIDVVIVTIGVGIICINICLVRSLFQYLIPINQSRFLSKCHAFLVTTNFYITGFFTGWSNSKCLLTPIFLIRQLYVLLLVPPSPPPLLFLIFKNEITTTYRSGTNFNNMQFEITFIM